MVTQMRYLPLSHGTLLKHSGDLRGGLVFLEFGLWVGDMTLNCRVGHEYRVYSIKL